MPIAVSVMASFLGKQSSWGNVSRYSGYCEDTAMFLDVAARTKEQTTLAKSIRHLFVQFRRHKV